MSYDDWKLASPPYDDDRVPEDPDEEIPRDSLLGQLYEMSAQTFTAWKTADSLEGFEDLATHLHKLGDLVSHAIGMCQKARLAAACALEGAS